MSDVGHGSTPRVFDLIWLNWKPTLAEIVCKHCREPYHAGHLCRSKP